MKFEVFVTEKARTPVTGYATFQNAHDYATRTLKSEWVIRDTTVRGKPVVGRRGPTVAEQVRQDLQEQKKIGVRVPAKVFAYVDANPKEIEEYYDDGMKIAEIADLVRSLA